MCDRCVELSSLVPGWSITSVEQQSYTCFSCWGTCCPEDLWEMAHAMLTLAIDLHLCLSWMEMESMSLCPSQPADFSLALTVRTCSRSGSPVVSVFYSAEWFNLESIQHHTHLYLWKLKLSIHWPILTKAFSSCNTVTVTSGKGRPHLAGPVLGVTSPFPTQEFEGSPALFSGAAEDVL